MRKFVFILTILIVMPVWAATVGSYIASSKIKGLQKKPSINLSTSRKVIRLKSENNQDNQEKSEGFTEGQKGINQGLLRVAQKWWNFLWSSTEERNKQVTVFKSENNPNNQDNQEKPEIFSPSPEQTGVSQGLLRVAKKWWASLWTTEEYRLINYSCK
jgi:hypothetical protein